MAERPAISPTVLADLTDAAPKRLVRKLDKKPELSEAWSWEVDASSVEVKTDREETVRLTVTDGSVRSLEAISCTCLLSPRCLHVLAVVSRLPLDDAAPPPTTEPEPDEVPALRVQLSSAQRQAARMAWRAGTQTLIAGATATGAVGQAELLRAVHACRSTGLHRLGAAGLRVVRAVRNLRADDVSFRLEDLSTSLRELLLTAHRLDRDGEVTQAWIGTARRRYTDIGNLRLYGLFTSPVVATGYAGVVTYLVDSNQRIYTISDVMPAEPSRARGAYQSGSFAKSSIAHRVLGRVGLFVNNATASGDHRLGSGSKVEAVRADACTWYDDVPNALWQVPLEEQLARSREWIHYAPVDRPVGWNFLFLEGTVIGTEAKALVVALDRDEHAVPIRCVSPMDHELLNYRSNLRRLGTAVGTRLRLCGRIRLAQPRCIELEAVGSADPEDLVVPEDWHQRVNIGIDPLSGSNLPKSTSGDSEIRLFEEEPPDPLDALRRRVQRVVLGGRSTLPPEAMPELQRETARLEARVMHTGAAVLRELGEAATSAERTFTGELERALDPVAKAWLRAALYERATTNELARESWR